VKQEVSSSPAKENRIEYVYHDGKAYVGVVSRIALIDLKYRGGHRV
jgi:hypothetical protein